MTELKTFVQRHLSLFSEGKIESVLSKIIINTCQLMRSALPISTYSQYFFYDLWNLFEPYSNKLFLRGYNLSFIARNEFPNDKK